MPATPFLLSHSLAAAGEAAPANLAVRCGDAELNYAELVDRVGRFAATLVSCDVRPGDRVGVHCSKSVEAVVAMHGAQWAGAVSVPIDPNAPAEMVNRVVGDASLGTLVLDARTARALPEHGLDDVVCIGSAPEHGGLAAIDWDAVWAHDPIAPVARQADDPAYIIYTSGSTGVPKGIVHSHRSGLRYAQLAADTYGLTADDRLANIAPFHFDQSTFELYAAPVAHARSVLVPDVLLRFPAEVAKLVATERLTVWYSVPTILVHLLERGALEHHDISSLRWVLFGGEVFPADALAALMEHLPDARFSNVYGPAEVNQCTHHHLDGPPLAGSSIPIGRAWNDTELLLVGTDGAVVEGPGRGVLEVRTATMMLGYWNRPDLTSSAIVHRLDDHGLNTRWYRTGDVCERDEDGRLHFLGRTDRQVKVRGNRVELEAVEVVLASVEGVTHAAAVVIDRDGEPALVGVIEGSEAEPAAAIATARSLLPAYAVPIEVIVVTRLPRTGSGKIDARAAAAMAEKHLIGAGS